MENLWFEWPDAATIHSAMKCDLCDKMAVVHEVTVKDGVKNEIHLCEEHAQAAGMTVPAHQPINKILTQFVISKGGRPGRTSSRTCPSCGITFAQFRRSGVLGCPECYDAFGEQIGPMIEQAQNGGTSHNGKCPKRSGGSIDRQLLIRRLVKELEDAVSAEQFERAAEVRDRIRTLESDMPATEADRDLPLDG